MATSGEADRASAADAFHELYVSPVWHGWEFVKAMFRDMPADTTRSELRYVWRLGENCAGLLNAWGAVQDAATGRDR